MLEYLFSTYEKAKECFNRLVEQERSDDDTLFDENKEPLEDVVEELISETSYCVYKEGEDNSTKIVIERLFVH